MQSKFAERLGILFSTSTFGRAAVPAARLGTFVEELPL
jgi:hypothetical protein